MLTTFVDEHSIWSVNEKSCKSSSKKKLGISRVIWSGKGSPFFAEMRLLSLWKSGTITLARFYTFFSDLSALNGPIFRRIYLLKLKNRIIRSFHNVKYMMCEMEKRINKSFTEIIFRKHVLHSKNTNLMWNHHSFFSKLHKVQM